MDVEVVLDEGQRQMVLLAIAKLALERPGWDFALGELADKLHGRQMFEDFKLLHGVANRGVDTAKLAGK